MKLIDADKLIAEIQGYIDEDNFDYITNSMNGKDVIDILRCEPAAEPTMKWHDALSEPPERDGIYLTCTDLTHYHVYNYASDLYELNDLDFGWLKTKPATERGGWYDTDENGDFIVDVDFWMEIPRIDERKD